MTVRSSRRSFLKTAGAAAIGLAAPPGWCGATPRASGAALQVPAVGWPLAAAILARIVPPKFPARDFDVLVSSVRSATA